MKYLPRELALVFCIHLFRIHSRDLEKAETAFLYLYPYISSLCKKLCQNHLILKILLKILHCQSLVMSITCTGNPKVLFISHSVTLSNHTFNTRNVLNYKINIRALFDSDALPVAFFSAWITVTLIFILVITENGLIVNVCSSGAEDVDFRLIQILKSNSCSWSTKLSRV